MKLFVVIPEDGIDCWMGNAESEIEAVKFAMVRHADYARVKHFTVWDHDLSVMDVDALVLEEPPL